MLFLLLTFATAALAGETRVDNANSYPDPENSVIREKFVLILCSYKDFHQARKQAIELSRATKVPFSMQGMTYDKKRGLIFPDDSSNEADAGSYMPRRYNHGSVSDGAEEFGYISIERSDAYTGFTPGYYIVVGGIYDDTKEGKLALTRFKPVVADAYTKKTSIYMGCIH